MKPTLRQSGIKKVTLTIEHHLGIDQIADIFLAANRWRSSGDITNMAVTMPKKKVIETVKDYLWGEGRDSLSCHVGDNIDNDTIQNVTAILRERFKEFN